MQHHTRAVELDARRVDMAPEDLAQLYGLLADRVRQIVRFSIRAPDAVIDDACQVAWSRLIRRWGTVRREAVLPWLVKTASREALSLARRSARELPLDALPEWEWRVGPEWTACRPPAPDEIAEQRARLEQLRALPERQQRLVWLQGLGLSYAEMAGHEGATMRTVERQLMRAKRALRSV